MYWNYIETIYCVVYWIGVTIEDRWCHESYLLLLLFLCKEEIDGLDYQDWCGVICSDFFSYKS